MSASHHRPLYLMIKPPRAVAQAIAADPRAERRTDQLHITLMMLGDRAEYSEFALHRLIDVLDHIHLPRFRVAFDTIHESARTVALRGSEQNQGACQFQAALRRGLARERIMLPGYRFSPHITLAYGRDGEGSESIDPISWLVDEFCLIESVHGEGRHIEHGRFALMPPPFALASPAWPRAGAIRRSGVQPPRPAVAQRQLALF